MDIHQYQKKSRATRRYSGKKPEEQEQIVLHGLVGEIGDMLSCVKKKIRDGDGYRGFKSQMTEEVGDILWYLAATADYYGISLAEAAKKNLAKIQSTFSQTSSVPRYYDAKFPREQQLPRQLMLRFVCDSDNKLLVYRGEQSIGDALSDNAYEDDGYRFHDAFHMAYAAMLGWSPVLRRLLKTKRKESAKTDEVEDGARGGMTEELVSLHVYMSSRGSNYEDPDAIDIKVLRTVRAMVGNLEVSNRTDIEWRRAISQGFKVFNKLEKNKGGFVSYDMRNRTIQYSKRKPTNARSHSNKRK